MNIKSAEQKKELFDGIIHRMKTWLLTDNDASPKVILKIAETVKKTIDEVSFWDFLIHSYNINDKTEIQTLLYYLAFENTVVNNTNQYVMKMIALLSELEGGDEGEKNTLQKLFEKTEITAENLMKGN